MAKGKGKKAPPVVGAVMLGFMGGILFFKGIMIAGNFSMMKEGSYLTNTIINRDYVLKTIHEEQEKELASLKSKFKQLASRKDTEKKLYQARARYHKELKALFEEGLSLSKTYKATNPEAEAGKVWEDKTRQVLIALTRLETQVQGHPVPLDFQGNFIWYNENNPNYKHAREILRERLNDVRHALVVLDTSGVAAVD